MTTDSGGRAATWYKDAVIYEVRTRSFFDSNDDGVGDLRGLASRLDYLADLGVTAIWLLPFYPSPGKDDGYDISDYTGVHAEVGTLADFDHLLAEAHRRGIRVITELVLNHTSDQHPWFQRARRAPAGSPERDFYVWASSAEGYPEARIIFKDFEPSNWAWDRVANAYYWHRFYAHQPDLNFENPAVHEALLGAVDFWLDRGVDGLRLDAVPYLYEEEGTNCENLPKTHAFLKKLRAHIDSRYENRLLLAEANQWPEDAAAYFGAGDECHMNFHFPLMPRMFMAIHMEDRFPIVDVFAQTPEVHPSCQWGLFLRNHDELTLEMVTDEERDTMYRAYAHKTAMRVNLGIRRRLAPLVGNNRRKIELLDALLLSLPGTPVLYYGDEIGMGDNVYLGDRNGVRTPMQWNMDRNAGFSRANPQQLILPVVIDPEFHYESLNVENQQQNPTSLLWWTKRVLAMRKRFVAFGRGSTDYLSPANPRILAFVRQYEDETLLVVANLSRFPQYTELDLSKYKATTPVELFGKARFPVVGDGPYSLTLGPHGFYWFSLERPKPAEERLSLAPPPPVIESATLDALMSGASRSSLDDAFASFLEGRPWFAGRDRPLRSVHVEELIPTATQPLPLVHAFVRVEYLDATSELYGVPLAWVDAPRTTTPTAVLANVRTAEGSKGALVDATEDPAASRALLQCFERGGRWSGERGVLEVSGGYPAPVPAGEGDPHKMGAGRRRTTLRFGDQVVLRYVRRLDEGVDPDLEVSRYVAQRRPDLVQDLQGAIELVRGDGPPTMVATAHAFVPNATNGWQLASDEIRRYFDRVLARSSSEPCPPVPGESALLLAGLEPPQAVRDMMGSYRDTARQLGVRTAELHAVLAEATDLPAFAPEPYSTLDRRSKYQSLRNLGGRVLRTLRERLPSLDGPVAAEARAVLRREADVALAFDPLLRSRTSGMRIRTHGNLHLGHALYTGRTFVFTGFEGLEDLSLEERRRKRSPLRDLAWMVRSFDYAVLRRLADPASVRETDAVTARDWALHWSSWASAAFLQGYFATAGAAPFLPSDRSQSVALFDAFLLEQVLHQVRGDLDDRSADLTLTLLALSRSLDSHATGRDPPAAPT
jgi:maltose alpha-D-glucosyltransferase/alpha-amylase